MMKQTHFTEMFLKIYSNCFYVENHPHLYFNLAFKCHCNSTVFFQNGFFFLFVGHMQCLVFVCSCVAMVKKTMFSGDFLSFLIGFLLGGKDTFAPGSVSNQYFVKVNYFIRSNRVGLS